MPERKSILIVDDELGPRESLRMILKDRYDVSTTPDGRGAIELISKKEFDVAMVDIKMPGMNGLDLLKEIKSRCPEIEVVLVTAYASVETAKNAIRYGALDYLIKPFDQGDVHDVVVRGLQARSDRLGAKERIERLQIVTSELTQEVETARRNIEHQYAGTVKSLLEALEGNDRYTRSHSERVSRFSAFLAEKLGLPPDKILLLEQAALIHDIGNIGIDPVLLRKTGPLTRDEFSEIMKHPSIGSNVVSSVEFLQEMIPVIHHHHERFDGTGFPDGLKGECIPLQARLVAVADALDAMLSDRPYRKALTLDVVRLELRRLAGKQFDPEIVHVALESGILECYTGIFSY